jgi:hypothetical protein
MCCHQAHSRLYLTTSLHKGLRVLEKQCQVLAPKSRDTSCQEPISELNYEKRGQDMKEAFLFMAGPCTRHWNTEENLEC